MEKLSGLKNNCNGEKKQNFVQGVNEHSDVLHIEICSALRN